MEKSLDYEALGRRIREAREQAHITQEQLGEICSLSTSHIGHIERGGRIPSVETIYKVASALHISFDYLFSDSIDANDKLLIEMNAILNSDNELDQKTLVEILRALTSKLQ